VVVLRYFVAVLRCGTAGGVVGSERTAQGLGGPLERSLIRGPSEHGRQTDNDVGVARKLGNHFV